jgi:DNA-binding transcriptional LysR family regulator
MLDSDRLRTFAAFAEDANLSGTARRLSLSQPAVHAQLKALADELGVALYQRVGRNLALTREGIEVAAFARETAERTRELVAGLRGEKESSPIVLAAGPGALVHLLSDGIRESARRGLRVEVLTADTNRAIELVKSGSAHVGVGVLHGSIADLEERVLTRAAQVVVVPRTHRLAKRRSVRLSDLEGEGLVLPPEGGPQRSAVDAALAAKGVRVHITAVARGWDVVLKLVEVGVGIGIVNDTCAIPRTLAKKPLSELPNVTYSAFVRRRARTEAVDLVRAFAESIRARR